MPAPQTGVFVLKVRQSDTGLLVLALSTPTAKNECRVRQDDVRGQYPRGPQYSSSRLPGRASHAWGDRKSPGPILNLFERATAYPSAKRNAAEPSDSRSVE